MPIYEIEAPDGRILEIEGEQPPSEAELNEIFASVQGNGSEEQPLKAGIRKFDWANAQDLIKQNPQEATRLMLEDANRRDPMLQTLRGGVQGLSKLGTGLGKTFANDILRPAVGKEPLTQEQLDQAYGWIDDESQGMGKLSALAPDLGLAFMLPEANLIKGAGFLPKLGNSALTNTYQGGALGLYEGLKTGNPLQGLGYGTGTGLAVGVGQPLATKIAPITMSAISGLKPDTLRQAVKAKSKALDMSFDDAQRLSYDTTTRFRNAFEKYKKDLGQKVNQAVLKLQDVADEIPIESLKNDVSSVYDAGQMGRVNPYRSVDKLEGNSEQLVNSMIDEIPANATNTLTPYELVGLRRQVGDLINWDNIAERNKNKMLSKIYNKFNERINNILPEVAKANKKFSEAQNLLDEKSRLRTILNPNVDIETAITKLENVKPTNENIYNLEQRLISQGNKPFLNDIADAVAAKDLERSIVNGRNFGGFADLAKNILVKPTLYAARELNKKGIPQRVNKKLENTIPVINLYNLLRGTQTGLQGIKELIDRD